MEITLRLDIINEKYINFALILAKFFILIFVLFDLYENLSKLRFDHAEERCCLFKHVLFCEVSDENLFHCLA